MSSNSIPEHFQEKTAAVIDVQRMAENTRQLAAQLESKESVIAEQRHAIEQLMDEKSRLQNYAQLGEREMRQMKSEAKSRLRAIVLSTGEAQRLQELQNELEQGELTPQELQRIHRSITCEFQSLFPTRPFSEAEPSADFTHPQRTDWSIFRIG